MKEAKPATHKPRKSKSRTFFLSVSLIIYLLLTTLYLLYSRAFASLSSIPYTIIMIFYISNISINLFKLLSLTANYNEYRILFPFFKWVCIYHILGFLILFIAFSTLVAVEFGPYLLCYFQYYYLYGKPVIHRLGGNKIEREVDDRRERKVE